MNRSISGEAGAALSADSENDGDDGDKAANVPAEVDAVDGHETARAHFIAA
jgi:hypothetical protein